MCRCHGSIDENVDNIITYSSNNIITYSSNNIHDSNRSDNSTYAKNSIYNGESSYQK